MISHEDIAKAQAEWADAVVTVGRLLPDRAAFAAAAADALERLYAFDEGEVLFKPTRATERPFRTTRRGALSYFVGGDADFPEDRGFALNPWTAVRFDNHAHHISGDRAWVMGWYHFTDQDGGELAVEYTFGYMKTPAGLKIFLHHSSMPYRPDDGASVS